MNLAIWTPFHSLLLPPKDLKYSPMKKSSQDPTLKIKLNTTRSWLKSVIWAMTIYQCECYLVYLSNCQRPETRACRYTAHHGQKLRVKCGRPLNPSWLNVVQSSWHHGVSLRRRRTYRTHTRTYRRIHAQACRQAASTRRR